MSMSVGDGANLCARCRLADERRCRQPGQGPARGCANHFLDRQSDCADCAYWARQRYDVTECGEFTERGSSEPLSVIRARERESVLAGRRAREAAQEAARVPLTDDFFDFGD